MHKMASCQRRNILQIVYPGAQLFCSNHACQNQINHLKQMQRRLGESHFHTHFQASRITLLRNLLPCMETCSNHKEDFPNALTPVLVPACVASMIGSYLRGTHGHHAMLVVAEVFSELARRTQVEALHGSASLSKPKKGSDWSKL